MIKVLIIGYGEVGQSIERLIPKDLFEVHIMDPEKEFYFNQQNSVDIIHVCVQEECLNNALITALNIKRRVIIVHTSIDIYDLATSSINITFNDLVIHSTVRGTHPNVDIGMKIYPSLISVAFNYPINTETKQFIEDYYKKLKIPFIWCSSPKATALAKLVNTTWYGLQIAFANQIYKICKEQKIDFHEAYTLSLETDLIGRKYELKDGRAIADVLIPRPVMIPGEMKGHCVIKNLKSLELYAPEMVKWIRDMSDYMRGENKD